MSEERKEPYKIGYHFYKSPGQCAICGKKAYKGEMMHGLIESSTGDRSRVCDECWDALPECVRPNLAQQPYRKVKKLRYAVRKQPKNGFLIRFANFMIYRDYIGLNGTFYHISIIKSIRLGFVPVKRDSETRASGYPLAVIELTDPHMLIQEPFSSKPVSYFCSAADGEAVFSAGSQVDQIEEAMKRDISEGNDHFINVEEILKGENK